MLRRRVGLFTWIYLIKIDVYEKVNLHYWNVHAFNGLP